MAVDTEPKINENLLLHLSQKQMFHLTILHKVRKDDK
jgi:hypothetical protein